MPQFEITVDLPEQFQYPVEVQRAFSESLGVSVTKVVKVQPKLSDPAFDHLFTDTQALVDAVRYDSTPGSFEDSAIRAEHIRQAPTVDQVLHDSVVRLEGAVTQLKRVLQEALRAVK